MHVLERPLASRWREWLAALAATGVAAGLAACAVVPQPGDTVQFPVPAPRDLSQPPDAQNFVAPGLNGVYATLRESPADPPREGLVPYSPYTSIYTPADPDRFNVRQIALKFVEGSGVRLRQGRLQPGLAPEASADATRVRLDRTGLDAVAVTADIATLQGLLDAAGAMVSRATPRIDEADLERLRLHAEARSGQEHGELNLMAFVHLPKADAVAAAALLKAVRALRSVETAYLQPIPFNAQAVDLPPTTTIDVRPSQGYLRRAPAGIDWDLARRVPGGTGAGVRIADIEFGWIMGHEDLPPFSFGFGINWGFIDGDHGTAVMGQLAAGVNGFGADGIAPAATIGWSGVTSLLPTPGITGFYSPANALLLAAIVLRPGDIALIEQHFPNPFAGPCPNTCNCAQFGYVAVETMPMEHLVIRALTSAGVVVVEAAGNGQTPVTPASPADSGAIVVGASNNARAPACFTNFGPRVDVHAWGAQTLGSLGYGDGTPPLRANGADRRQWYTTTFGGTSGAAPIVAGAAALVQSTRTAAGLARLNSMSMRALLASTGTPQVPGRNIGPQPDLARALATYLPDSAAFLSQSAVPTVLAPGAAFTVSTSFRNSGGRRWSGGHRIEVAPSFQSGAQDFAAAPAAAGTANAPLLPGDTAAAPMTITAPSQPGSYPFGVRLVNGAGTVLARAPLGQITVISPNQPVADAALTVLSFPGSLRSGGAPGTVVVRATNTGQTTWAAPAVALLVQVSGRLVTPNNIVPIVGSVVAGQSQDVSFQVSCNSQGQGNFNARMGGFGQSAGRTVVCQPQ
jgi:hypothetical protein